MKNFTTRLRKLADHAHADTRRVLYLTDHGDGMYTADDGRTLSQADVDGLGYPVKAYAADGVSPDDWDTKNLAS